MKIHYLRMILLTCLLSVISNVCVAGLAGVSRIEVTPSSQNRWGWLQVSEVIARESGTGNDVALRSRGAQARGSSNWPGSNPNYAIDGRAPDGFPRIFHSRENNGSSFLIIDLAAPTEIESLSLYGRNNCCWYRDIFNVRLFDAQGRELFSDKNLNATSRSRNRRHRADVDLRNVTNPYLTVPGSFNAFETSTSNNATTGRLFTKLVGTSFAVDIMAISSGRQMSTFSDKVIVDLVENTVGASLDANNCPEKYTIVQKISSTPISGGRSSIKIPAVTSAYRDVRIRIQYPVDSPKVTSCSTDNFAIRPTGMKVSSTSATQTDSSGKPVIKTGAYFDLTASSVTGYDGTPRIDNTKIIGSPVAGKIGGGFSTAQARTGAASGKGFYYTEVGNFGLEKEAVYDALFTRVDQSSGDCTTGFSNVMVDGRYGCSFGSSVIEQKTGKSGFGRFIPDNFAVELNTPQLVTGCGSGRFTYVGQSFSYATSPIVTVTARSGTQNGLGNDTTLNYTGDYMKLTSDSLTPATQTARYTRFSALGGSTPVLDTSMLPTVASDPVIKVEKGKGTLTFNSGTTGLAFIRSNTTPSAPFNADIALAINVIDEDDVVSSKNVVSFGAATAGNGMAFNSGQEMRFGRLRLKNALGSELLALQVPMEAQYWNGTGFVTNVIDNCTQIAANNVGMTNFIGNISAGVTTATPGAAFVAGVGQLNMSAPGAGNNGSVDLVVNLGANAVETPCVTPVPNPVTTGSNDSYLRGAWCGAGYDKDPTARITFGVYKGASEMIYMREQY